MSEKKIKKAHFLVRAAVLFVLFAVIGVAAYRFGHHAYRNVAEWSSDRMTVTYNGDTYLFSCDSESDVWMEFDIAISDLLGEIKPAGLFEPSPVYLVYEVENREDCLIVKSTVEEDGVELSRLYYLTGTIDPTAPENTVAEIASETATATP